MIGIYHNRDLDGFCSGAIIKHLYPDAKMIGADYGKELDLNEIDGPVIMADVSFPMDFMVKISEKSGKDFTWIDHHVSAIKAYNAFIGTGESFCESVLVDGTAACELTWKELCSDPLPLAVKLLSMYDTWQNKDAAYWDNIILPFQFGMRLYCNSLETFPTQVFVDEALVLNIIEQGKIVLKYQEQQNEVFCKSAFECNIDGNRAICLNTGMFNSGVFKSVYDPTKHDIMVPFKYDGKQWIVSFYTTNPKIDCSIIAKNYGGGGHAQASGAQFDDIRKIIKIIK